MEKADGNDEKPSETVGWRPQHIIVAGCSPSMPHAVVEKGAKKWLASLPKGIKTH